MIFVANAAIIKYIKEKDTTMFYTTFYSSPLGRMTLASDGTNLVGAWFEAQKHYEAHMPQHTAFTGDLFIFRQAKHWLDVYFGGDCPDFSLPLNPVGSSPFRTYVWQILQQIPYGQTITYGDIAKKLQLQTGKRVSAQAVGSRSQPDFRNSPLPQGNGRKRQSYGLRRWIGTKNRTA